MTVGNKYCSVCGKEKEYRYIKYADINAYIECECEKKIREEREKDELSYAMTVAHWLKNRSSHLSRLGSTAFFSKMTVDKYNEKAISAGKYILELLLENKKDDKKCSLVLQGNRGSGKTFISSAIINEYNSRSSVSDDQLHNIIHQRNNGLRREDFTPLYSPCKFITEMDLYAIYYDNFNYCRTDSPVREFKQCKKVLVIDDVGSSNYDKNKIQAMYHNILDYRYSENLPVVFTTNLDKREMSRYIGDRAFDRLQAYSYYVDLTSPESRR